MVPGANVALRTPVDSGRGSYPTALRPAEDIHVCTDAVAMQHSASDNAISTPTSTAYRRRLRFVAPVPLPDLSSSFGSVREMLIAGARPTANRQKSSAATANTNTRQLICGSTMYLPTLGGIDAWSDRRAPIREHEAEREAGHAEDDALAHQMRDDADARRSQRRPKRELAATSDAARELNVRQVGASDEQDRGDRGDESVVHRTKLELRIRGLMKPQYIILRSLSGGDRDPRRDHRQLALGVGATRAGAKPDEALEQTAAQLAWRDLPCDRYFSGEPREIGHDADDDPRLVVDRHGGAHR